MFKLEGTREDGVDLNTETGGEKKHKNQRRVLTWEERSVTRDIGSIRMGL